MGCFWIGDRKFIKVFQILVSKMKLVVVLLQLYPTQRTEFHFVDAPLTLQPLLWKGGHPYALIFYNTEMTSPILAAG